MHFYYLGKKNAVEPFLSSCNEVQFSSVAQLCPTLCDPMNHSTPGLPIHHQLPEYSSKALKARCHCNLRFVKYC